ncbi:MAG: pyruvate kinase [Candidatus Peribacter sp.]|jgi:pyruvate kinase|nr:pyruvate kinase [Candidatus Peribacter sp.]MBT4392434.1 pyruvate kinase [Candidatus Peribacter sp.]MBT4601236.1 pyruvate kinase [Candidatus Peribacter sp.]MBT5149285.1 pyruvate kinase [Candidatus Peribacter sp.]MBT5637109.1 pyruvate kinase [Candidatus Peribacter sp.]
MNVTHPLRRTKIVCTIGPSSWETDILTELANAGMNVARLNFSHGDRDSHQEIIDRIQAYNASSDLQVGIMLDTKGAEIRTGDVQDPILVAKGEEVVFSSTASESARERKLIEVSYDGFAKDVIETDTILIDNGEISFDIVSVEPDGSVIAKAREKGEIGTRRHINLPGADIDLPSITESDWEDLRYGAEKNLDFLALSFIRNAAEVEQVRALLEEVGSTSKIISKIETQKGVNNIKEIIDASDGIMVARGDLGADLPFEKLPAIQDEIVCRCKDAGKPVIIATHMLESMKEHPVPTRAEVTDTAHAVATGTDSTMLSGETASGSHPLVALQAMIRIHHATEEHLSRLETTYNIHFRDSAEEEMDKAIALAEEEEVEAFVLITETGRTANHISKFRAPIPIIALTKNDIIQRSLSLSFGVYALKVDFDSSDDVTMQNGVDLAQKIGLLKKGQKVMLLKDRANKMEVVTL